MRITKRIQKALAGNWGKPDKMEKDVKIPDPLFTPDRHTGTKRDRKKNKDNYHPWSCCPFCRKELPLDYEVIKKEQERVRDNPRIFIWEEMYRVKKCDCGAYEVKECPACKNHTWYNPKTEIYKHSHCNCGFVGKKKIVAH